MSRPFLSKFINRNPRNLEQLGLQPRTGGYGMDVDRDKHSFIYRANFTRHRRFVEGQIQHYKDGVVLSASSREKQISSQLFSPTDVSASANIGRILALRCATAGIHFIQNIDLEQASAFFAALADGGVRIGEQPHIEHTFAVDPELTYDTYEVTHTREDNID